MATVRSPLAEDARKIVGEALQGALIDLIDLSLIAKQAHWNIIGPNFRSVHLQLDEVVKKARKHMDVIAERAVAIGVNPDGRAATVANTSDVRPIEAGYIQDEKVVGIMTDTLWGIAARFRDRVIATDEPDPVSQDLLIAVSEDLEQQHWMFEAMK
ncbi:Dps family protein [Allonocardiopsis opalescens]|uniref:Starvation-inducible DNA-binding protein n=1 Tax=Allonocardiopsis opalescens TaxID=1144618 RepID=A0A2T0QFC3_9ACTN|nr:DNA starvation/stationary phase protection protein [Allonocardiopsis opalescens]PRY02634.1 starvation-inducible DNA-binding protein [Allonocardiopsis opalescens]